MSSLSISQATYSSALRFGLSPIMPVEEEYTEKIRKFKLVHKIIRFVPQQTYSYEDYTALFYEDVLRSISTPPKFEDSKIHKCLIQRSMKVLEKTGLKERIDELEKLRKDRSVSSIETQHDIMIDLAMELSSMVTREEESKYYAERFLNSSNFQLSYFAELMNGSQTYKKFLNVMEYELRLLKGFVRASMQRGATAAVKRHDQRRRALHPLIDASDRFRIAAMALKTYVEICNSEKVEQLFELKSLDGNKLNKEEFSRLFADHRSKRSYFESEIFERKPELFMINIDFNQPINNMWKKLVVAAV